MTNSLEAEGADMGDPGRIPATTPDDVLDVFAERDDRGEPLTAPELAEQLSCSRRTALNKLHDLEDAGDVASKKVGGRSKVWWRPIRRDQSPPASARESAAESGEESGGGASTPQPPGGGGDRSTTPHGDESDTEDMPARAVGSCSYKRDLTAPRRRHLEAWIQHAADVDGGVQLSDFKKWWTDERAGETGYNAGSFWEAFAKATMKQSDRFTKPDTRTYRFIGSEGDE